MLFFLILYLNIFTILINQTICYPPPPKQKGLLFISKSQRVTAWKDLRGFCCFMYFFVSFWILFTTYETDASATSSPVPHRILLGPGEGTDRYPSCGAGILPPT